MRWKTFLREYFNFSRKEKYGIIILCGLIMLAIVAKQLVPKFIVRKPADITAYEKQIDRFLKSVDSLKVSADSHHVKKGYEYFYFDPNTATDNEWVRLGMNERQIRNIRNYQAKGGHFKEKTDLKKLYTIPVTLYENLEPYITIIGSQQDKHIYEKEPDKISGPSENKISIKTPIIVELNTTDSATLTQLSGIGPVFASRIIKYRNMLGGFVNIQQLNEVYGVKQELVERLASQITIDTTQLQKISINTLAFRDLTKHPYLNAQQARGILKYRELQGSIKSLDELKRNHILTEEDIQKLSPYIKCNIQ